MEQLWAQNYNPLGNAFLSTLAAAIPVTLLFYLLAVRKMTAWLAAVLSFAAAIILAATVFGMPAKLLGGAIAHGLVYAVIRIIWTLVAAVFVYEVTVATGHFKVIMESIGGVTDDRRMQVLLIAFAFGAVLEGSGGGGAPVAICGAMMVGIGFKPFEAAVLCLIANTAPVAWGGMGNPIRTLVAVTGLPDSDISAMVGRILPWTAIILPAWLVRVQCSWRETFQAWPGLLACGVGFAVVQFSWSNFVDSSLVDIMGGMITLLWLSLFFKFIWQPKPVWRYPDDAPVAKAHSHSVNEILHAWSPFLILAVLVVAWGLPAIKNPLDATSWKAPVPWLHNLVLRQPPVVAAQHTEPAIFDFAWLSSVGTATFLAGMISGPIQGLTLGATWNIFVQTLSRMRYSVIAILAMIGLGYITRYSGMDAVLGLAMANTGFFFPFFGTLIGWLGVALTGTDAGSNALFGSLQVITANKLGLSPVLMGAANSAGGVMGKMIDAQSIIVACAATGLDGEEGNLFKAVLKHSVTLAIIVGMLVMLFAYVFPWAIPHGHKFW
jgi:lactate permease